MEVDTEVADPSHRIFVGSGFGVQRTVVSAGTPAITLGHHMKRTRPGTLGRAADAFSDHTIEFGFGSLEFLGRQVASLGEHWLAASLDEMCDVVLNCCWCWRILHDVGVLLDQLMESVVVANGCDAGCCVVHQNTFSAQKCLFIDEHLTAKIDQKVVVAQKIRTNYRTRHISNGEKPRERATETE